MRILILGGSKFLGRHIVDTALRRGHAVTTFNRGQTNPNLHPEVEKLWGDRNGGLESLRGHEWDAVIDTSGHSPGAVRQSVRILRDVADHYTFISSISVYSDFSKIGIDESDGVLALAGEPEPDDGGHYGARKASCEQKVREGFGDHALVIRPGLLVGPHDPSDRFTYWVDRFARGGEILVPNPPGRPIQFIDARDLADWAISMLEERLSGVFNATGPATTFTMGDLVSICMKNDQVKSTPVWVEEDFLQGQGVKEWTELPLWIAQRTNWPGFMQVDVRQAIKRGLRFRSADETVRDTLEWRQRRRSNHTWQAGLRVDREQQLLQAWRDAGGHRTSSDGDPAVK